jgi:hypothetical protein
MAKQLCRRVAANDFSPAFQGRVKAENRNGVASATHEHHRSHASLTRRVSVVQLFPALKGRAKFNSPLRGDNAETV